MKKFEVIVSGTGHVAIWNHYTGGFAKTGLRSLSSIERLYGNYMDSGSQMCFNEHLGMERAGDMRAMLPDHRI
jgi:hypothetical protein